MSLFVALNICEADPILRLVLIQFAVLQTHRGFTVTDKGTRRDKEGGKLAAMLFHPV